MKKNKKIIGLLLVVVLILIVVGLILFQKTSNDNNELSFIEEITFNENEKEILKVLKNLDYKLQHPESEKNNEQADNLYVFNNTESISLKEFVSNIYEIRKKSVDNGEFYYIMEANTIIGNKTAKRFIILTNENLFTSLNDTDIDYSELEEDSIEQNEDGGISMSFGKSFYKAMLDNFNQQIQEEWNNAEKIENVNYNKLLKSI